MYANRRNFRVLKEIGVEGHDGDVRVQTGSENIAVSCMRHTSGHNCRNSLFIVDVAMGQTPRFTERISSCVRELVSVIFRCNCCLCVRSKQYGRFMCRWAQFRQALDEIEANVKNVCSGSLTVNYRQAIGGGYYISVTSGFFCVDIRKFFVPYGGTEEKPTRQGIALRLREWSQIRKLVEEINNAYPVLGTALPCYLQDDHLNQLGALQCRECYPFSTDT